MESATEELRVAKLVAVHRVDGKTAVTWRVTAAGVQLAARGYSSNATLRMNCRVSTMR